MTHDLWDELETLLPPLDAKTKAAIADLVSRPLVDPIPLEVDGN